MARHFNRSLRDAGKEPTSAMRKFSMNLLVDQFMRHSGFMPHNGHGYVRTRVTDAVVSDGYSFIYHEHVYGYHDYDLMGFGTNAISSGLGYVVTNTHSKKRYVDGLANGKLDCHMSRHDINLDYARAVILRLPYHGCIDKSLVHWNLIPPETLDKLHQLKHEGLVCEDDLSWSLTKLGWYWYVNLMYFLMPENDQLSMNALVVKQLKNTGRSFVKQELLYPVHRSISV